MKKVLVYDEEILMLDIIKNILRYYECDYDLTETQDEFSKKAKQMPYDLIFFDIDQEQKDVQHMLQTLRSDSQNTHTPIIGVTASPVTKDSENQTSPQEKQMSTFIQSIKKDFDTLLKKPFSIVELSTILEQYQFIKKKSFQKDFILRESSGFYLKEAILILEQEKNISLVLESTNLYEVHAFKDSDLFLRIYHRKHYLFSTVIVEKNEFHDWKFTLKNLVAISPLPSLILVTDQDDISHALDSNKFGITTIMHKTSESTTILKHMQQAQTTSITSPRRLEMIQSWVSEHNLPCEELLKRLLWKISLQNKCRNQNSLMNLFYGDNKQSITLKNIKKNTETYLKQRINSSKKSKILVVEDETYYRQVLHYLLKPTYKVYLAENTNEAKKILTENNNIQQMILDIYLPGKLGDTFFMEIKEHHPDMSVLIITAYKEIPKAFHLLQNGAVDYINKPFKSTDLFKALGITWLSKRWPQIKSRPAWYALSYWERLMFLSHLINERKRLKKPFFINDFYALFPEALEKDKEHVPIP